MSSGDLRSWIKSLVGDGFTISAIAKMVDRNYESVRAIVRSIEKKGEKVDRGQFDRIGVVRTKILLV